MLTTVIDLGLFVQERLALLGLNTQRQIYAASKVTPQTQGKIFKAKTDADLEAQQFGTLHAIAQTMRFDTWREAVDAWRADEVRRGLPPEHVLKALRDSLPRDTSDADQQLVEQADSILAKAKTAKTPAQKAEHFEEMLGMLQQLRDAVA